MVKDSKKSKTVVVSLKLPTDEKECWDAYLKTLNWGWSKFLTDAVEAYLNFRPFDAGLRGVGSAYMLALLEEIRSLMVFRIPRDCTRLMEEQSVEEQELLFSAQFPPLAGTKLNPTIFCQSIRIDREKMYLWDHYCTRKHLTLSGLFRESLLYHVHGEDPNISNLTPALLSRFESLLISLLESTGGISESMILDMFPKIQDKDLNKALKDIIDNGYAMEKRQGEDLLLLPVSTPGTNVQTLGEILLRSL